MMTVLKQPLGSSNVPTIGRGFEMYVLSKKLQNFEDIYTHQESATIYRTIIVALSRLFVEPCSYNFSFASVALLVRPLLTGGPPSRRVTGDDSRKSKTTKIKAISVEVIFPQKFGVDF
jgi:hypothetical protein